MYIPVYIYIISIYTYTYIYVCSYIHTYVRTYIHTYVYIYIYIWVIVQVPRNILSLWWLRRCAGVWTSSATESIALRQHVATPTRLIATSTGQRGQHGRAEGAEGRRKCFPLSGSHAPVSVCARTSTAVAAASGCPDAAACKQWAVGTSPSPLCSFLVNPGESE